MGILVSTHASKLPPENSFFCSGGEEKVDSYAYGLDKFNDYFQRYDGQAEMLQ